MTKLEDHERVRVWLTDAGFAALRDAGKNPVRGEMFDSTVGELKEAFDAYRRKSFKSLIFFTVGDIEKVSA